MLAARSPVLFAFAYPVTLRPEKAAAPSARSLPAPAVNPRWREPGCAHPVPGIEQDDLAEVVGALVGVGAAAASQRSSLASLLKFWQQLGEAP